jgi:Rieske 2Fe-2S family protein
VTQDGGRLVDTLPGSAYTSPEVFAREVQRVFRPAWICVGRSQEVLDRGAFLVHEVQQDSVLVVRARDGVLRAFHNVCRHRGALLCDQPSGRVGKSLRCMYHGWSYSLDGRLVAGPDLAELPAGTKEQLGLAGIACEEWLGYVWVNLDGTAAPLRASGEERARAVLGSTDKLERYAVDALRLVSTIDYDVAANWKLIAENFMECYHCAPLHPELSAVLPQFAAGRSTMLGDEPSGARFAEGTGYSLSGRASGPRLPGLLKTDDQLHAVVLYPTTFLVLTPDHVAVYRLRPLSAERTALSVDTLFDAGRTDLPDFAPDDTIALRDITVRQDIAALERTQKGVASSSFRGVLMPAEQAALGFYRELLTSLGEPVPPAYEAT